MLFLLARQVHTHDAAFEKLNREHTKVLGGVRTEKALLEVHVRMYVCMYVCIYVHVQEHFE